MKLIILLTLLICSCKETVEVPVPIPGFKNSINAVLPIEPDSHKHMKYLWEFSSDGCLQERFKVPTGFTRVKNADNSFGEWLRHLPLKEQGAAVKTFNGRNKTRQDLHAAVIDIDTGKKDLQQCADAVIRLRAEYLYSVGRTVEISFKFTSGDPARWTAWMRGLRPEVKGNKVTWKSKAKRDTSHAQLRKYLDSVFTYAGTLSLNRELQRVKSPKPGDVFIQGGSPGHAVIVVDVCENDRGEKRLILAQSYMPAQDMHILKNTVKPALGVWHIWKEGSAFPTAEWKFKSTDLKRF